MSEDYAAQLDELLNDKENKISFHIRGIGFIPYDDVKQQMNIGKCDCTLCKMNRETILACTAKILDDRLKSALKRLNCDFISNRIDVIVKCTIGRKVIRDKYKEMGQKLSFAISYELLEEAWGEKGIFVLEHSDLAFKQKDYLYVSCEDVMAIMHKL